MTEPMNDTDMDFTCGVAPKNLPGWNRKSTHVVFIFLFVVIAIGCGVIYYVNYSDNDKDVVKKAFDCMDHLVESEEFPYAWDLNILNTSLKKFTVGSMDHYLQIIYRGGICGIIYFASFTGKLKLLHLLMIRSIPGFCTYFGIFFLGAFSAILFFFLYLDFDLVRDSFEHSVYRSAIFSELKFYLTQSIIRSIMVLILVISCVFQVYISVIVNTIKKSLRAMFFFPTLILFGMFILILNVLVVHFVYSSIWYTTQKKYLYYMTILGSMYLHLCIYYFGKMVISQTIATWHWAQNKEEIPKFMVLRSIAIVCRYHLGAVFFSATVVLPLIVAVVIACRHKYHTAPKSGNWAVQIICKIFLIIYTADYALIITSVYGYDFFKATKKMHQLIMRKCSLSLAVIYVFYILLIIGSLVSYILYNCLEAVSQLNKTPWIYDSDITYSIRLTCGLVISLLIHIFIIAESAVHTTLLYTIDHTRDSESSIESEERTENGSLWDQFCFAIALLAYRDS